MAPAVHRINPLKLGPLLAAALVVCMSIACNLHFDVDSVPPPAEGERDTWSVDTIEPFDDCDTLGLTSCQNRCRDLQTDPYFCGSCTNRCAPTETCDGGQCVPTTCPFDPGAIPGSCDPVRGTGCSSQTQICIVTFVPSTGRFATVCENPANLNMDTQVGSPCTSVTDCVEGASCVIWEPPDPRSRVCSKICQLETGLGCSEDEFCVNPHTRETNAQGDPVDVLTALGYCTRRCSPTNLNTCPPGQACAPDEGFAEYACHANFRCLENGAFAGKSPLASCDRTELHRNGCPSGLICMPEGTQNTGDRCVRPCVSDTECAPGACSRAPAPWDFLKVCTP